MVAAAGAGRAPRRGRPEGARRACRPADGRLVPRGARAAASVDARRDRGARPATRTSSRRRARGAPRLAAAPSDGRGTAARSRSPTRSRRPTGATIVLSTTLPGRCHAGARRPLRLAARALGLRRRRRGRARGRHDQGGRRRRARDRDPRACSLWVVQTPQVFRRESLRGRSRAATCARLRRRPAGRGGRRRHPHRRGPAAEPEGHDRPGSPDRGAAARREARDVMLTDYHTHLRPDETGPTAGAYFTEATCALPRGRGRAGHRGARLLRARPPLPRGARRLAPSLLGGVRRRRPRRLRRVPARDASGRPPGQARPRARLRARPRGADRAR